MHNEDFLRSCAQRKDGIRLVEPSDNLCSSYIKMARESLESMNANISAGVRRWALVASYYARYNALYAVFMKIGLKCEIHDCTLNAAKVLLGIKPGLVREIEKSKEHRINMQYYADRTVSDKDYAENIESAPAFVIAMEKVALDITTDDISRIRRKFEDMMS